MIPKDTFDKVISLLQDIGSTNKHDLKIELSKIPDAQDTIFSLPMIEVKANLLEGVIRGICLMESGGGRNHETPRFGFGSTTVIPKLLEQLKRNNPDKADKLTDWLFSNRASAYIPYGYQIPLGINSRQEYRDHEERRAKHREEKLAADQEAHRAAVARKKENARLHAARSAANRVKRNI